MIADGDLLNVLLLSITILIFITTLPLFKIEKLKDFPKENLFFGTIALLLVTLLLIGLRNPYASWRFFGDSYAYNLYFHKIQNNASWIPDKDFGFFYYTKIISQFVGVQLYFLINAFLYIFLVYFGFKKWFKEYTFFAIALFIASFTFWGFGINTIRNGLAGSIFIFALSYYNKRWILVSLIALSVSIHLSMLLPAFVFLGVHFVKNSKLIIRLWLVSIPICFLVGKKIKVFIDTFLTSTLGTLDKRANYEGIDTSTFYEASSFRLDFIIYSGIVVFYGYYFIYQLDYKNKFYTLMYNTFVAGNTIWMYFIYVQYTDRIAYLSWIFIPFLLIHPIIYSKNIVNQSKFIGGTLGVSLTLCWLIGYL